MPVSVDDPFLLASYTSTTYAHQLSPAVTSSVESNDRSGQDDTASLLAVAVQGQGVQLYNVSVVPLCLSDPLCGRDCTYFRLPMNCSL